MMMKFFSMSIDCNPFVLATVPPPHGATIFNQESSMPNREPLKGSPRPLRAAGAVDASFRRQRAGASLKAQLIIMIIIMIMIIIIIIDTTLGLRVSPHSLDCNPSVLPTVPSPNDATNSSTYDGPNVLVSDNTRVRPATRHCAA